MPHVLFQRRIRISRKPRRVKSYSIKSPNGKTPPLGNSEVSFVIPELDLGGLTGKFVLKHPLLARKNTFFKYLCFQGLVFKKSRVNFYLH